MDWQGWLDRWDAQQRTYVPEREERFAVIADVVEASPASRPRVLDLGCGPGRSRCGSSTVSRARPWSPSTPIRCCSRSGATRPGRDRGSAGWTPICVHRPGFRRFLVACTMRRSRPPHCTGCLLPVFIPSTRRLLLFSVPVGSSSTVTTSGSPRPALSGLAKGLHVARWQQRSPAPPAESWEDWWEALRAEPDLSSAFAERDRRRHEHPLADESDQLSSHVSALRGAGFAEVGTVWQRGTDRVLVALR